MDFLKKIFLIIFCTLGFASSNCEIFAQNIYPIKQNPVISSIKPFEKDCINSKENEFLISPISNSTLSILRKNNEGFSGSFDENIYFKNQNNLNLISCSNISDFSNSNSELALLFLLFELQPNAP